MRRRIIGLMVTLTLGLLAAPLATPAQPATTVSRLGLLSAGFQPAVPDWRQHSPFLRALREPRDLDTAFAMLSQDRPDALYVVVDPLMASRRAEILHFVAQHRAPTIYTARTFVDAGGLLSDGANFSTLYARTATYVDRILKGTKPADLPVERPRKFELVINLKTAQAFGLPIPPSLLFQADEVIR